MTLQSALWLLAACWLAYFALHSWLASLTFKRWVAARWPGFMPAYRLAFNLLALLLLAPILLFTYALPGPWLWRWEGAWGLLANGFTLLALVGVAASSRGYDMAEFIGWRQWRGQIKTAEDQEGFRISTFHRFVRHPWYFCALILVWSRDMNPAILLSSVMLSAYFVIGSRLEERKLVALHGNLYRRYMRHVAGLFPLPGKTLSAGQAERLLARYRGKPYPPGNS